MAGRGTTGLCTAESSPCARPMHAGGTHAPIRIDRRSGLLRSRREARTCANPRDDFLLPLPTVQKQTIPACFPMTPRHRRNPRVCTRWPRRARRRWAGGHDPRWADSRSARGDAVARQRRAPCRSFRPAPSAAVHRHLWRLLASANATRRREALGVTVFHCRSSLSPALKEATLRR